MPNDRLRDAMLRNGLTPAAVAEHLGVDPKTVERWVTQGRAPYPKYRHAIGALLKEAESYLWPNAVPAERANRVAQSEVVQVYPRRAAVPDDLWRRLIDQAQEYVGILAYAGLFLPEQQSQLIPALKAKAEQGARIEILLGDPDSAEVAKRGAEEGIGDAMASKVHNVLAFYRRLRDVPGVAVHFHKTTLYNSIYCFDDEMLVNAHVFGFPAAHTPVMHLRRLAGGDLFGTYADSFDRVWSTSVPVWAPSVAS
ncbi:XRE family transcriptional regulator [Dactylosporangium sp. NPDC049742]|uniref:XRE family transcriptional regulator n=1 Tax=Dactylosporangium sp. NPDC049742 TaxID=3154737 RepID=UPI00343AE62B